MKTVKTAKRAGAKRSASRLVTGEAVTALAQATPEKGIPTHPTATRQPVVLHADCTSRNAAVLQTALLRELDTPDPVMVEIGAVERIDTSCLQLLTAFARERQGAGRAIVWGGRNEAFSEAVRLLGLAAALGAGGMD